jgi:SAM-dependent methyltransferase
MNKGRFEFERGLETFMNSTEWLNASWSVAAVDYWREYIMRSKSRFRMIYEAIPHPHNPIKILDIGPSPFTLFIKEIYPYCDVSTLDATNSWESQCKARDIRLVVSNLDSGGLPFEDSYFDSVIFSEVLEHLFIPPTEILQEIRRVMRERGKLILSVPNFAALYQRIRLLWGISPLENADNQMNRVIHGHIHEYTKKEITVLLRASDFTIVSTKYLPAGRFKERGIRRLVRDIYDPLVFLIPPFRSTIQIECLK